IQTWYRSAAKNGLAADWTTAAARIFDAAQLMAGSTEIDRHLGAALNAFDRISRPLQLDLHVAFETESAASLPLAELRARAAQWLSSTEQVTKWIAYEHRRRSVNALGMIPLAAAIHTGQMQIETAPDSFDSIYALALLRAMVAQHPHLAN